MSAPLTRFTAACLLVAFLTAANACAIRPRLKIEGALSGDVKGTYSLILYGCTHFNDLRTMAILDREGDRYSIEPYAPDFNYRVIKNLSARESLKKAENFVAGCNPDFMRSRLTKIETEDGLVAGYEIVPLYWAYVYPGSDVLDTAYFLDKDRIIAVIKLRRHIEMMRESDFGRIAR